MIKQNFLAKYFHVNIYVYYYYPSMFMYEKYAACWKMQHACYAEVTCLTQHSSYLHRTSLYWRH